MPDPQPYAAGATEAALWPATEDLLPPAAAEAIAACAAEADERGSLPDASLEALRGSGYLGLPVPSDFSGGGAGLLRCAAVQRRLAMADPALAIAANMHLFSVGMMVEHWLAHRDRSWLLLEAIASQRRIVASAFAEPGLGGSILRSRTTARPAPDGYLVDGVKAPCSLAARCDLVCLQMQLDPPGPDGLLVALLPASAEGLVVEQSWDALGMRASESDTLRLERCFVPDELVFHRCEPGFDADPVFAAGLLWFCVSTAATYLGLARAALDQARDGLRRSRVAHLDAARAALPSVQGLLGESVAAVLALEAACVAVAGGHDRREGDPRHLLPVALATKHAAVEACTRAVAEAAELLGAQSYARRGPLARLWRDVQAARFHPPTRPATRQILGRWALDLPFTFELSERPQ